MEINHFYVTDVVKKRNVTFDASKLASLFKIIDSNQIPLLSVSSVADAMVTWLRDGNPVRTGPGHQQRRDGTRLILTMDRVTQLDNGTYGCQLTTPEGLNVASATWRLRVNRTFSTPELLCPSVCPFTGQSVSLSPLRCVQVSGVRQ